MSNIERTDTNVGSIEEDRIEKFIKAYEETKAQSFILESINKDFFFEFADCLIEKIKKLEEEKKNRTDFQQKYIEVTNLYLNSIPKQKVKDKKEELKKEYEIELEENSTKAFILKCKISALEELLEENNK